MNLNTEIPYLDIFIVYLNILYTSKCTCPVVQAGVYCIQWCLWCSHACVSAHTITPLALLYIKTAISHSTVGNAQHLDTLGLWSGIK